MKLTIKDFIMKKIVAIVILLVLSIGVLMSCTEDSEDFGAFELYQQMMEAMANAESIDIDIVSSVVFDGESVVMSGNVRQVMRSETDVDLAMSISMDVMGMELPMKMYFRDGVLYTQTEIFGEFIRNSVPMPVDEAMIEGSSLPNISADAIIAYDIGRQDSSTRLELVLDGEAVSGLMDQAIAQLEVIGMYESGTVIEMGDVTMEIVIAPNDSMLQFYRMLTEMSVRADDEAVNMTMETVITVNSHNDIAIVFPDDLDEW